MQNICLFTPASVKSSWFFYESKVLQEKYIFQRNIYIYSWENIQIKNIYSKNDGE